NLTGSLDITSFTPGVAASYSVGVSGTNTCETLAGDRTTITFTPGLIPGDPTVSGAAVRVASLGSTVVLQVDPIPSGATTFQWAKDGVPLAETSATLTLSNVTNASAGVYTVRSVSANGCVSVGQESVTLQVTGSTLWKSYVISGGGTSVRGGEDITFTISLRNDGAGAITNYTIKDPIPANTTLKSIAGGGTNEAGVVTWTGVSVAPNATVTRSFTVTVNADLSGITAIRNVAFVNDGVNPDQPSIPADPSNPNNPGDPTQTGTNVPVTQVTNKVTWKSFTVSTGATTVRGGEEVTYTIHVRNTGNQRISPLIVRDALPANTSFVSAADGGSLVGNEVVYSTLAVNVGVTATASFVVRVNNDLTGVTAIRNIAVSNDGVNPDQPSIPADPGNPNNPGDPTQTGTDIPVTPVTNTVTWKS
ncbi:MAG: DUF11 domain-containing protein, partial [Sphingobacteriales bacterium]